MVLLDFHLDEVPELQVAPHGEYTLRCVRAEVRTSEKTGGQYLALLYEFADHPDEFYPVSHVVMFPTPDDDPSTQMARKRGLKRLFEAHGVDLASPDTEDLIGKEVQAVVTVESDPEYGDRNRIRRFL